MTDLDGGAAAVAHLTAELAERLAALTADDVPDERDLAVAARPSPPRWQMARPSIFAADGERHDTTHALVVGRAATGNAVDVAVASPLVSRRHALLWSDGDALLCRDLGSKNGTIRVRDGARRAVGTVQATLLAPGDALVTADDIRLVTIADAAHQTVVHR